MEAQSGDGLGLFGPFLLERLLGRGGMAEVLLALERGLEGFRRRVVIKRVLPHLADDPEFVQMFLGEARLAARLQHPGIVHVYEFGCYGGSYFLSMEYVEGASLAQICRRLAGRPFPVEHAIRIVAAVCEALQYTHTLRDEEGKPLGLVHRDVSPQNILVSVHGTVKLADFGIAKATEMSSNTRAGTIKGKFPYMSPERLLGTGTDGRSDVFAAGVVLCELVTGRRLYVGDEPGEIVTRILNEPPPILSGAVADAPAWLDPIVSRALAKRPVDRYPTAGEMQMDLERCLMVAGRLSNGPLLAAFLRDAGVIALDDMRIGEQTSSAPVAIMPMLPGPVPTLVGMSAVGAVVPTQQASTPVPTSRRASEPLPWSEHPTFPAMTTPTSQIAPRPSRPRGPLLAVLGALVLLSGVAIALLVPGPGAPRVGAGPEWPRSPPVGVAPPQQAPSPPAVPAAFNARAPAAEAPAPAPLPPAEAPTPPVPMAETPPAAREPAVHPGQERPTGLLSLDTTPWSRVYFHGRFLGETPLAEVRLPAGTQVLTAVDSDGQRHVVRVQVEPDGEVRRRVTLE